MHMASAPKDAYAVLGVDPAADDATIAAAYRMLARRYHPDIAGEAATRRMMRINAAWDQLRDPKRRAAYDLELAEIDPPARPRPGGDPAGDGPRPSRRSQSLERRRRGTSTASITAPTRRTRGGNGPPSATAPAPPADHPDGRRAASCRSGGTSAGRSARSRASTPATSSGSRTGPRAGRTSTRSTRSSDGAGSGQARRADQEDGAASAARPSAGEVDEDPVVDEP